MFGFKNTKCQSCGMPLSKDPQGGGTNADGTKSTEYCSNCFQKGAFIQPNMTVEQMTALVRGFLKEQGTPNFLANLYASSVPRLRRWKSKPKQ